MNPSILTAEVRELNPAITKNGKEYTEAFFSVMAKKWNAASKSYDVVPGTLVLEIWSKSATETLSANVGRMVSVEFVLESSEYGDRWYTRPRVVSVKALEPPANRASDDLEFD